MAGCTVLRSRNYQVEQLWYKSCLPLDWTPHTSPQRWECWAPGTTDLRRVWLGALTDWGVQHVMKTDRNRENRGALSWGVNYALRSAMLGEKILSACLCLDRARTHTSAQRTCLRETVTSVPDIWSSRPVYQVLTRSLLLCVAGRVVAVGVQGLRPLLAGRVAGLVGVPGLFAVVAELSTAALSATNQPGTAGTARGDDGEPKRKWQTGRGVFSNVVTEEVEWWKQEMTAVVDLYGATTVNPTIN